MTPAKKVLIEEINKQKVVLKNMESERNLLDHEIDLAKARLTGLEQALEVVCKEVPDLHDLQSVPNSKFVTLDGTIRANVKLTKPVKFSDLKNLVGKSVLIDGETCKVESITAIIEGKLNVSLKDDYLVSEFVFVGKRIS